MFLGTTQGFRIICGRAQHTLEQLESQVSYIDKQDGGTKGKHGRHNAEQNDSDHGDVLAVRHHWVQHAARGPTASRTSDCLARMHEARQGTTCQGHGHARIEAPAIVWGDGCRTTHDRVRRSKNGMNCVVHCWNLVSQYLHQQQQTQEGANLAVLQPVYLIRKRIFLRVHLVEEAQKENRKGCTHPSSTTQCRSNGEVPPFAEVVLRHRRHRRADTQRGRGGVVH
mmetsp:Transcript_33146/g.91614  ORF Transcript_33146/g.91614 Transcript_33146/m.91614 type:complete len:225 (-) Transcript_33146:29-703(-)